MSLQITIKDEIKKAMLAKDSIRLNALRNLSAAFTNELVAKGMKPQDELSDDLALGVIKRLAKQRKDSIEQFEKANRTDLAEDEKSELAILETFLPATMSKEDIKKVAEAKKAEMGVADKAGAGKLIGAVSKAIKETGGNADGGDIKEVVDSLFA
ncbi:MAG: hypothetical protein K0S38_131 [Candidatus Paceibacter sp.]|jgi:uncharacterized protein YqeY|nr:hypothetical protein [Candidatus Paceibacter sp.]